MTHAPRRFFCVGCSALVPRSALVAVDLDSMSEAELERLYAGLTRLAELPPNELQALVQSVLADKEDASPHHAVRDAGRDAGSPNDLLRT
jgi:hypothetical protein